MVTVEERMARVLLVDDDRDIRDSLREALEVAGHDVGEAADGETALRMLRASDRRLVVLLDVMMPRVSGFDVLGDIVRDDELAHRHAFVFVTAYPRALPPLETVSRLSSLGMIVPILAKPFEVDVLLAAVSDAARRLILTAPLPVAE